MAKKLKHGVDFVGVATCAIIKQRGKFLLIKRKPGTVHGNYWAFPGGKLDHRVKWQDNIKREIKEETGLTLLKSKLLFCNQSIGRPKNHHFITIWFSGKIKGKAKLQLSEVTDLGWFSKTEVLKKNLAFRHLDAFKEYVKK